MVRTGRILAKRGAKALLGEIPGASLIMEGAGVVSDIKREKSSQNQSSIQKAPKIETGEPTRSERIINLELYGNIYGKRGRSYGKEEQTSKKGRKER